MLLFTLAMGLILVTAFLLHCDDLFLDGFNLWKRIRPHELTPQDLRRLKLLPQRRFALLIPNWKEGEALEQMVRGNLSSLAYENYSVFLGVYRNDPLSWAAARKLEQDFAQVSVIVNDLPGPTSKAQLLNEMVRKIFSSEELSGLRHDLFLVQDAEDVMHPLALQLLNSELETADLVQLPVLSLPLRWQQFTAGTYADELAEAHNRDLLARSALGATLPSTGAGVALNRTLLKSLLSQGSFLSEGNAAENYHLGMEAGRLKFRSRALSAYRHLAGKKDFIATRKFFPENTKAAISQKARWTTGIAFQGAARFGWGSNLADRYFFWRDRRGPWTTLLLALASWLYLIAIFQNPASPPLLPGWLAILSLVNALLWVRRVLWRMRTTAWVHGWKFALLVPLRWPVGNFINSISTWRALSHYGKYLRTGKVPVWVERSRKMPEGFGLAVHK
jgi:adsorption protein B